MNIEVNRKKGRIGVIIIGHEPYWPQFPGLKEELLENGRQFESMVKNLGGDVISYDFVDSVDKSFEASRYFKAQDIDMLFCFLTTYVTSSSVVPAIMNIKVPTVLFALQPLKRLDYARTTTYVQLVNDTITALPEISGVLSRGGFPQAGIVVGTLHDDPRVEKEIMEWCKAADVARAFKYSKIGYLGHTYEGMYDMNTDPTAFTTSFGSHVQMLEMCDLAKLVDEVTQEEIDDKIKEIKSMFDVAEPGYDPITKPIKEADMIWSARTASALDKLVSNFNLTGLAYYYRGLNNNLYERIASSLILGNSLLTAKGIPLAGEADLKTCAAMLIMDRIGAAGSFAELHPCDFTDDIVMVGHDGPHNIKISDSRPVIRGLDVFHGKSGSGISVEFSIKAGDITLLGISQTKDGRFKMISIEGTSLKGEIPKTGNTNTRCHFGCDTAEFVEKWCAAGPTHHFALGTGHVNSLIRKVSKVLNMELEIIH